MNAGVNYFERFYQLASVSTDVLEKNANDYPYSSLAGFLLLYHYKKTNHPGFEKLSKKTALHFKNASWLQFLLSQVDDEKQETAVGILHTANNDRKEVNEISEAGNHPPAEIAAQTLYDPNPVTEIAEIKEINSNGITGIGNHLPAEMATQTIPYQGPTTEIAAIMENDLPQNPASPRSVETTPEVAPEILPEQDLQSESAEVVEPVEILTEIPFEPLHTVDYFASQGIKITEEPLTSDKLGNQMKSFTAWLKSMKKLHPSKLEEPDLATEKLIQNSAEESNVDAEILTEAMAEVLIKQDKKEKAIEMYHKLSLINPSKSVYFAAKIESIKSS